MADETIKKKKEKTDKPKKNKKGAFEERIKGVFNKGSSKKNIQLYEDKKDNRTWVEGKEILYRKWEKKMDIEYDSDPDNKKNDGKEHKHKAQLMNVEYAKNSILIKDSDTKGGYCSYPVDQIKIKLAPRTDENYKEPPIKPQHTTQYNSTYGYTRDNYTKNRADAPDIPKDLKGFKRIDYGLNLYYEMMGRTDYKNATGKGKFMEYVEDNDLQENEIEEEEFNGEPDDCTYIDIDEDFPFKKVVTETKDNKEDDTKDDIKDSGEPDNRAEKIFEILKYCYKYAFPKGHPDYEAGYGGYQGGNFNNDSYNNGNMYGHSHHHHHGYHYESKPAWDPSLEFIMPPKKENIIKDEHIIDTIGNDPDNKDKEGEEEEEEEEEETKNDPRKERNAIERNMDIPEEEMSTESDLYQWEEESETTQQFGGLERIDNGLRIYYEKLGRRNYISDNGNGKFVEYAEDNGLDSDAIEEEFEVGAEECTFVEFAGTEDEDKLKFPLSVKTTDISEINEKIYRLIKYCFEHAHPPISHVNDADISLINGFIRQYIEGELKLIVPVVILEVIREFYPSANFFFSFDDDWNLKITEEQIDETKRIIKKQLNNNIVEEGDLADLIPVITMGRLNGDFPLMQYLFDGYIRGKVKIFLKFGYGTRLFNTQPESFLLKYPFCNKLKIKDPESFAYFLKGLKQYNYAKLFPCIVPMSLSIKDRKQVKDDVYKIFYYFSGVIQFINLTTTGRITPWQFDLTIIFYKVFSLDGRVWSDGQTQSREILTIKKQFDETIGDIQKKLENNECCYVKKEINSDDIISSKFVLDTLTEMYEEFKLKIMDKLSLKDEDDYPKRWRICFTIDRRKTLNRMDKLDKDRKEGKDLWFLYEARLKKRENAKQRICYRLPSGIDKEFDHLIPEMYHINSMECLIPGSDHKTDVRTRLSFGITLSFHCEQINQIKGYLWWDNSFMRFMTNDLNTIFPCWFYDENDYEQHNSKFRDDEEIKKEVDTLSLTDLHFKDFLKSWTLKKTKK